MSLTARWENRSEAYGSVDYVLYLDDGKNLGVYQEFRSFHVEKEDYASVDEKFLAPYADAYIARIEDQLQREADKAKALADVATVEAVKFDDTQLDALIAGAKLTQSRDELKALLAPELEAINKKLASLAVDLTIAKADAAVDAAAAADVGVVP